MSKLKVVYECPWCDALINWDEFDDGPIQVCWGCQNMVELKAGHVVPFEPPDDELEVLK